MQRIDAAQFNFFEIVDTEQHIPWNSWRQLKAEPAMQLVEDLVRIDRWVVSPDCRDYSLIRDSRFADVHYVESCFTTADGEDFVSELALLMKNLNDGNRFDISQNLTALLGLSDMQVDPRLAINARALPFRPHLGVFVIVESGARSHNSLMGLPGVVGFADFAPRGLAQARDWEQVGDEHVTIYWLDDDPIDVALPLVKAIREQGQAAENVVYATAAETIYPWEWDWFE